MARAWRELGPRVAGSLSASGKVGNVDPYSKPFHWKTLGISQRNKRNNNKKHQAGQGKPTTWAGDPTPPLMPLPAKVALREGPQLTAADLSWVACPSSPALGNELIIDLASQGPLGEQSHPVVLCGPGQTLTLSGPVSCSVTHSLVCGILTSLGSV